jgi:hypothetical protein
MEIIKFKLENDIREVSLNVLESVDPNYLLTLVKYRNNDTLTVEVIDDCIVINRNIIYFDMFIDYLKTKKLKIDKDIDINILQEEFSFYGIDLEIDTHDYKSELAKAINYNDYKLQLEYLNSKQDNTYSLTLRIKDYFEWLWTLIKLGNGKLHFNNFIKIEKEDYFKIEFYGDSPEDPDYDTYCNYVKNLNPKLMTEDHYYNYMDLKYYVYHIDTHIKDIIIKYISIRTRLSHKCIFTSYNSFTGLTVKFEV